MVLDVTTDSIQLKLGAAHTTRALQFYASYHTINHTTPTITPKKNFGSTNGTTAVTLVPAPSSGEINQLKYSSIYNCDSVDHTVTVEINSSSNLRTVYSVILKTGEQIQFTVANGWISYNKNGILKTFNLSIGSSSVKATNLNVTTAVSTTQTSGTDFAYYLGKADRNFNVVVVQIRVGTAAATITWAEAAIYKGRPSIGAGITLTRCGWVDVSQGSSYGVNSLLNKTISIPINENSGDSPIFAGDDIWFVYGNVASTPASLQTTGIGDQIDSGFVLTVTGSLRPSTNSTLTMTVPSGLATLHMMWQGSQTR